MFMIYWLMWDMFGEYGVGLEDVLWYNVYVCDMVLLLEVEWIVCVFYFGCLFVFIVIGIESLV